MCELNESPASETPRPRRRRVDDPVTERLAIGGQGTVRALMVIRSATASERREGQPFEHPRESGIYEC